MRIAVAQINPTLGDFKENTRRIISFIESAKDRRSDLIVFPECSLFGYHPFDLLERPKLVDDQLEQLKLIQQKIPKGMGVLLGLITKNKSPLGKPYFNSAAFLTHGKKPQFFHKTLLPTGDVFDEARFIETGDVTKNILNWKRRRLLITICEDIWAWPDSKGKSPYRQNPLKKVKKTGLDLVINLSASPWYPEKMKERKRVTGLTARYFRAPLLYANLVGGQDEIIFDGASFLLDSKGKLKTQNQAFEEDLNLFDLETLESWSKAEPVSLMEELRRGLVLGLRDFVQKTGFRQVHLGLSGGIDSALVACLAVDALGAANVQAVAMPGPFSSDLSLKLAQELSQRLGIRLRNIPITKSYELISHELKAPLALGAQSLVHENLQSRLRGLFLMAISNQEKSLLLTTGNKSEYATGYATLYGDMCGGLAPIGDLTKQQVFALSRHYNAEMELIPLGIIDREPSAELRPDQKDSDSLPPYEKLDAAVQRIVEQCLPEREETERWLLPLLYRTEFKRWQAPPILKASAHSFGRGRRYPIAHRHRPS